jgi:cysteine-rich repeat protein
MAGGRLVQGRPSAVFFETRAEKSMDMPILPTRRRHRHLIVLVMSALIAILVAPFAAFAENSVGCRAAIARSVRRMAGTGMRTLDACHEQLNRGEDVSCDALPSGIGDWSRQTTRTGYFLTQTAKCPRDDEPVRNNYPPCTDCDNITAAIVPGAQALLEANAAALLGETALSGRAARCQEAIAKARARIARRTLARAQACQRKRDRKSGNTQFGAIDDACLPEGGRYPEQQARVVDTCRGLSSAEVGTCDPLPDCVLDAAETLGRDLATVTYGEPRPPVVCGDGNIEAGEDCDDGNAIATDACTDTCQNARCGDGIVWEGVEECDDGNTVSTDGCDACHLPVCGDGVRAGSEECDDGNDIPDDGCTNCAFDPVLCGAGGMRATVTYADPQTTNAAAGIMLLEYPPAVGIPGSGPATSVRQRVTNLSGASSPVFLVSDVDTDADATDDAVRIVFGTSGAWPTGPFTEVRFDCTSGTPVRAPDFQCRFLDASDAFSNAIDPALLVCAVAQLQPIP